VLEPYRHHSVRLRGPLRIKDLPPIPIALHCPPSRRSSVPLRRSVDRSKNQEKKFFFRFSIREQISLPFSNATTDVTCEPVRPELVNPFANDRSTDEDTTERSDSMIGTDSGCVGAVSSSLRKITWALADQGSPSSHEVRLRVLGTAPNRPPSVGDPETFRRPGSRHLSYEMLSLSASGMFC